MPAGRTLHRDRGHLEQRVTLVSWQLARELRSSVQKGKCSWVVHQHKRLRDAPVDKARDAVGQVGGESAAYVSMSWLIARVYVDLLQMGQGQLASTVERHHV